jgi:HNH endonuclease
MEAMGNVSCREDLRGVFLVILHIPQLKFLRKAIEYEVDNKGCWNCINRYLHKGRPFITLKQQVQPLARVIYTYLISPIFFDYHVCHKCDNPTCINPSHLFLGTHLDNMADMISKNRMARGTAHGQAKFTDEEIRWIRANKGKYTGAYLAQLFKVSNSVISEIKNNRSYSHVT